MPNLLFHNSPIEIVDPEGKGNLGNFFSEHDPVRLEMGKVIEKQPGYGQGLEVIKTTSPFCIKL